MPAKIDDGLNRSQRYRLKDLDEYRKRKSEYARTPEQRAIRTEYMRQWREKNREKHNAQSKASHHRNKHKHVGKAWASHLRSQYGLTVEQHAKMLEVQGHACALCFSTFKNKRSAHVDHCHTTGRVRGILCVGCNTMLGRAEKATIERLKKYLEGNL